MTVSATLLPLNSEQVEMRYVPDTPGENRYQVLLERSPPQVGAIGSPVIVAAKMSLVAVMNGKGPFVGIRTAPLQRSLGGTAGRVTFSWTAVVLGSGGSSPNSQTTIK